MTVNQQKTLLVFAIIAGALSLSMTWFTLGNVQLNVPGGMGGMFHSAFAGMNLNVNGFNGSVSFLVSVPLWFVICTAVGASVLQLLRHSRQMEIPVVAEWITAGLATFWTTIPILLALTSGRVSVGMGWILGLFSAAAPLATLIMSRRAVLLPPGPMVLEEEMPTTP